MHRGRPKAFRRRFADVSFQAHRGQCNRLEKCRRGDNPCLGIGGDRIGEHRDRSEDGYTRDCVGNVFVMGIGDGIGGNDGRCAADRRSGRDEQRELGLDAQQVPHPDGKNEGGAHCRRDNAETSAADPEDLARRQWKPERENGDTKQPAEAECHALFRPGRRTDDVVERDSNHHGQDHGIERRHARQLSDGERRSRDNRIKEQARQNFAGVPAGPSLDGGREAGAGPVIQRFGKLCA